jgi:hypothetical protein
MFMRSGLLFRYGRYNNGYRLYSQKLFAAPGTFLSGRPQTSTYNVYSYGEHFPCAIAFFAGTPRYDSNPRVTFFNTGTYSQTTARHMSLVRGVFSGGRSGQTILADSEVMQELSAELLQENFKTEPNFDAVCETFIGRARLRRKQRELDDYNAGLHKAISRIVRSQPLAMRHAFLRADMDEANQRLQRSLPE